MFQKTPHTYKTSKMLLYLLCSFPCYVSNSNYHKFQLKDYIRYVLYKHNDIWLVIDKPKKEIYFEVKGYQVHTYDTKIYSNKKLLA